MAITQKPLERYIQVLEIVAASGKPVALTDVVNILGLPKTTVYRLVKGLVQSDLIVPNSGRNSGYSLSERTLRLLHLGATADGIEFVSQHHLQELSERVGFTSFLCKMSGYYAKSIVMRTPAAAPVIYVVPGSELSPHGSASGKAIFAHQPREILERILSEPLAKLTNHTITDPALLVSEYEKVRENGYAKCVSEDVQGFAALACPIKLPRVGVLYSVGITGTVDAFEKAGVDQNLQHLREAAGKLTLALQSSSRMR